MAAIPPEVVAEECRYLMEQIPDHPAMVHSLAVVIEALTALYDQHDHGHFRALMQRP